MNISGVLTALADPSRLELLRALRAGEICVGDLQAALKTHQPKVSRHLAYLRRAGLVDTRREGRWIYYRIKPLDTPLRRLLDAVFACSAADPFSDSASSTRHVHQPQRRLQQDLPAPAEEDPMLFD